MRRRVLFIIVVGVGLVLGAVAGSFVYARRSAAYQRSLARKALEESKRLNQQSRAILFFAEAQWLMEQRNPVRAAQVLAESEVYLPGYSELARKLLSQGLPRRTVFEGGSGPMRILPSPDGKKLWISPLGGPSEIIFIDNASSRIVLEGERETRGAWTRDSLKLIRQYDSGADPKAGRSQCLSDITTGKTKSCFPYRGDMQGGDEEIGAGTSFDGRLWAFREPSPKPGKPGAFRLFDSASGADLYDPQSQKPEVFSDARYWSWHPREYRLALFDSKKKMLRVVDATSGAPLCSSPPIQEPVENVFWSWQGRYAISVLQASQARVWDAVHCAELRDAPVDSAEIIRLSARGPAIESWMPVGSADIVHPRSLASSREPPWIYEPKALSFSDGFLLSPRISNSKLRAVFRPSGAESVYIKNIESNTQGLLMGEGSAAPAAMLWGEDGKQLYSIAGHSVYEWNADGTAAELLWHTAKDETLNSAAWSPDGSHIAVAHGSTLRLLDPDNEQRSLLEGNSKVIRSLAWSQSGRAIVATFVDGEKKVWDAGTREHIPMTPALEQEKLFVGGDEQRYGMLVIGDTGGLRMIPLAADQESSSKQGPAYTHEQILARPGSGITYAAWSPTGDRILSLSRDGSVHLWAMSSERLRLQLQRMNADCMPAESRTELLGEPSDEAQKAFIKCKSTREGRRQQSK